MTSDEPITSRPAFLAADAANDDQRSLREVVEDWHAIKAECHAFFGAGTVQLPEDGMDEVDLAESLDAATEEVALTPAASLAEVGLKAEIAAHWLGSPGGLQAVEAAFEAEMDGDRNFLKVLSLSILRDLLRLIPGEGRSES